MLGRITFRCISLACIAVSASAQNTAANAKTYAITGVVMDQTRTPIPSTEIELLRSGASVIRTSSDAQGRFNGGEYAAGDFVLTARRIGYEPYTMNVNLGKDEQASHLELTLVELPQHLEEVLVKSDENGRLKQFMVHKSERSNFGKYFDRTDIRKKNPLYASELLRTVPGVHVEGSSNGGNLVRIRGCMPMLWVDGQRVPQTELDEIVRPSDIAAMEFYSSNAGVPPEFMDRNNRACGVIVVWTKSS